jgi:hypothetical protein
MNTDILTIISNYAYLFLSIIFILDKKYFYGFIGACIWLISHIYHLDTSHCIWSKMDIIVAFIAFVYVLIKCKNTLLCFENIILLILLLSIFFIGFYCFYNNYKTIYNIIHSFWHILSALFITYLIYQHEKYST